MSNSNRKGKIAKSLPIADEVDDLGDDADDERDDASEQLSSLGSLSLDDVYEERKIDKTIKIKKASSPAKEKAVFKKRLFVGEGSFSGITTFLRKHEAAKPGIGKAIVATEYRTSEELAESEPSFTKNVKYLESKGVTVICGVDATKLPQNKEVMKHATKEGTFPRIHFNFPYATNAGTTTRLVSDFFKSASKLQNQGDRIHMALVQPQKSGPSNRYWWQAKQYGIQNAANGAGYKYTKKRQFLNGEMNKTGVKEKDERYDGYEHAVTDPAGSRSVTVKNYGGREFIFSKTNQKSLNLGATYKDYGKTLLGLQEIATDSDSSDCVDQRVSPAVKKR